MPVIQVLLWHRREIDCVEHSARRSLNEKLDQIVGNDSVFILSEVAVDGVLMEAKRAQHDFLVDGPRFPVGQNRANCLDRLGVAVVAQFVQRGQSDVVVPVQRCCQDRVDGGFSVGRFDQSPRISNRIMLKFGGEQVQRTSDCLVASRLGPTEHAEPEVKDMETRVHELGARLASERPEALLDVGALLPQTFDHD